VKRGGKYPGGQYPAVHLLHQIGKPLRIEETERQMIEQLSQRGQPLWKHNIDFSACPPAQLEACRFYEYARESRGMISWVEAVHGRKLAKGHPDDWLALEAAGFFLSFITEIPEFPKPAWLDLPKKRRQAWTKNHALRQAWNSRADPEEPAFQELDPTKHLARLQSRLQALKLAPYLREQLPSLHEMFLGRVNLWRRKEDLRRDFDAWIDRKKQEFMKLFAARENPFEGRGRSGSPKDDLRKLAAFRVRKALGWNYERLAAHFRFIYRSPQDWSVACDNCEKRIRENFGS